MRADTGGPIQSKRYRILPRKGAALLYTMFFGFMFAVSALSFDPKLGVATLNGRVVTGSLEHYALATAFMIVSAVFLVWYGRRLIPGSPFDFLEIGPDGLTVGGLLGRRRHRWESIARFSVRAIPGVQPPVLWLRAVPRKRGDRDLRFFMGGYTRFRPWVSPRKEFRAIADWLEAAKRSYGTRGGAALPAPPEALAARIIEVPPGAAAPLPERA